MFPRFLVIAALLLSRGVENVGEKNMKITHMPLDEAIRFRMNDERAAREYEQKEQMWMNEERIN